ncbi:MAG: UDP-N-acetylmuramate--L-alanine ligase [Bdellovibrionota bacterium]
MYKRTKDPVHFVGIGGIGMSGIAEILVRQGFPVSGSDLSASETTRNLESLGAKVHIGHGAENLAGAKVLVVSSAIQKNNPELLEAQRQQIPVVQRAEMLAEVMRLKFGVAVAGTHGKTTTTSMLASILAHAELDPTIIVGGKINALGSNAKLGQGQFIVAEADESDGSFLHLSPVVTVITNIDNDHLDYYGKMEKLRAAFVEFANKIPYYGRSILCIDDAELAKTLPLVMKPHWTYGFSEHADFRITDFKPTERGCSFAVQKQGDLVGTIHLQVPGRHNALNAVGALAAALELDVAPTQAIKGIEAFAGVRRRFEFKGELLPQGVRIIDDYGHHPTEIKATLAAAKSQCKGRLIVAFQPHRFTRTQICWGQFTDAFQQADKVYLSDIYAAGEPPIEEVTSEALAETIPNCRYSGDLDQTCELLQKDLCQGDLLLTLGAGSITQLSSMLLDAQNADGS